MQYLTCLIELSFVFCCGLMTGLLCTQRWRQQRVCWAQRRLQLHVLSLEIQSLRQKIGVTHSKRKSPCQQTFRRIRPTLRWWQRYWISRFRLRWPSLTTFLHFSPQTYVRWLQEHARRSHHRKVKEGLKRGRPPIAKEVVELILQIKRENPRYSAGHIARMISAGELGCRVCKQTVAKILKQHGFRPRPQVRQIAREAEPGWLTTLYNQHILAIDFKCVLDLAGNTLYIFNVIDHGRRILHRSVATYHPTSQWVEQQLRNTIMTLEELPAEIVMDRDSIFGPIAKRFLPRIGIRPLRIAYKCPWQNGIVERFHRTLNEDLLRYVQPLNERHLNRLLREYQHYYNTCRPHMSNRGESPARPPIETSKTREETPLINRTKRKIWLGGLHSSYHLAA